MKRKIQLLLADVFIKGPVINNGEAGGGGGVNTGGGGGKSGFTPTRRGR